MERAELLAFMYKVVEKLLVLIYCVLCCFDRRKHFKRVRTSVVTLQKHLKKHIQRRRFVKQCKAALVLQRHRRGQVARAQVRKLKEEMKKKEEEQKKKEEEEKKALDKGEQEEVNEGDEKKAKVSAAPSVSYFFFMVK